MVGFYTQWPNVNILSGLSILNPLDAQLKCRFIYFVKKYLEYDNAVAKNVALTALNNTMSCCLDCESYEGWCQYGRFLKHIPSIYMKLQIMLPSKHTVIPQKMHLKV